LYASSIFGAHSGRHDESGAIDAIRGHRADGTPIEPGPSADNPPAIGPGGRAHMSLGDWAKYLALHLRGVRGDVKVGEVTLKKETFTRLHTPFDGPGDKYAMGWVVAQRGWAGGDGTVWMHNGSNTMWFCVTWLAPGAGFGVLVTTNIAGPTAQGATDEVCGVLIQEHLRRVNAKEK
jgi:CubicO group peptidase (beta-lactamase class C family)